MVHNIYPVSYLASRMTRIDERRPLKLHVGALSEGDGVGRARVEALISGIVLNAFLRAVHSCNRHINTVLDVGKRESVLIDLHAGRVPPVVDVESGGGEDDDNDEEYGHDHGGLARLAKGEDAAHLQRINSFNIP